MVNAEYFVKENLLQITWDRWSLPIRFVVFSAFGLFVLDFFITSFSRLKIVVVCLGLYLALSSSQYRFLLQEATNAVEQSFTILDLCREKGLRKVIVKADEVNRSYPVHYYSYLESLVFSSYRGWDQSIHVIYEMPDQDFSHLLEDGSHSFYMCKSCKEKSTEILNQHYYRLNEDDYVYIQLPE